VEVVARGESPVKLDQAMQFYRRIDGKTQPVGTVEKTQLDQWSAETDLQRGKGIGRAGGRITVELGRFDTRSPAVNMREEVRKAGYPAVMTPIRGKDQTAYVVRVRQLASRAEGEALADQLRGKYGVTEPKVSR
jgi:hypothetical protein